MFRRFLVLYNKVDWRIKGRYHKCCAEMALENISTRITTCFGRFSIQVLEDPFAERLLVVQNSPRSFSHVAQNAGTKPLDCGSEAIFVVRVVTRPIPTLSSAKGMLEGTNSLL